MTTNVSVAEQPRDRVRILVVDDSRVIRKAVEKILGGDFEITEAEDGEAGWERLAQDETIEVLITDIMMPRLDGYGLICRVRAADTPRLRDLPIIAITGAEDDTVRERAYACGATDFIVKPIDKLQLIARARAHARLDQALRRLNEAEEALEAQTMDPVTGFATRQEFQRQGDELLIQAFRDGRPLSLLRFDIDDLRTLYDTHGDEGCDKLFACCAEHARRVMRPTDAGVRLGGGRFALLLPATGDEQAVALAELLRAAVAEKPCDLGSASVPVTVSLGAATTGQSAADSIDDLLARAEQRLTLAKAAGGNRFGIGYEAAVAAPEIAVLEQPDLETALKLLEAGDVGKLTPYLPELLARLLPLLDHGNEQLGLGLDFALDDLRDKLSRLK
ncbi:MAG: diguanylate cyclase [Gammaproteobacteria bacterium]|nr:MAG: diguanylate cyclase [Gammaproteobacteria bacterium]